MSPKPSVAVIIPFYNGSRWIERALASVERQTITPTEVIVVNDGSLPDERETLGALSRKYDFMIIDKENGGQSSARNLGVGRSTSEVISFLDQDDLYPPEHIEILLKTIPENSFREWGFSYSEVSIADEFGRIYQKYFHAETQPHRHPLTGTVPEVLGSGDMFILPSATLISRSAFLSAGGFDTQFMGYEDDDLFLRIIRADYLFNYTPHPTLVWCQRPTSTSYTVHMSRSRLLYLKRLVGYYAGQGIDIWELLLTPLGIIPMRIGQDEAGDFLPKRMMPRFGHVFYQEAFNAKRDLSPKCLALTSIFKGYTEIVLADKTVPRTKKSEVLRQLKKVEL